MKIFFLLMLQVLIVVSQNEELADATWCFIGNVATLPPKPIACASPTEVYACGYGEARCDNFGYCGTPPCTWR